MMEVRAMEWINNGVSNRDLIKRLEFNADGKTFTATNIRNESKTWSRNSQTSFSPMLGFALAAWLDKMDFTTALVWVAFFVALYVIYKKVQSNRAEASAVEAAADEKAPAAPAQKQRRVTFKSGNAYRFVNQLARQNWQESRVIVDNRDMALEALRAVAMFQDQDPAAARGIFDRIEMSASASQEDRDWYQEFSGKAKAALGYGENTVATLDDVFKLQDQKQLKSTDTSDLLALFFLANRLENPGEVPNLLDDEARGAARTMGKKLNAALGQTPVRIYPSRPDSEQPTVNDILQITERQVALSKAINRAADRLKAGATIRDAMEKLGLDLHGLSADFTTTLAPEKISSHEYSPAILSSNLKTLERFLDAVARRRANGDPIKAAIVFQNLMNVHVRGGNDTSVHAWLTAWMPEAAAQRSTLLNRPRIERASLAVRPTSTVTATINKRLPVTGVETVGASQPLTDSVLDTSIAGTRARAEAGSITETTVQDVGAQSEVTTQENVLPGAAIATEEPAAVQNDEPATVPVPKKISRGKIAAAAAAAAAVVAGVMASMRMWIGVAVGVPAALWSTDLFAQAASPDSILNLVQKTGLTNGELWIIGVVAVIIFVFLWNAHSIANQITQDRKNFLVRREESNLSMAASAIQSIFVDANGKPIDYFRITSIPGAPYRGKEFGFQPAYQDRRLDRHTVNVSVAPSVITDIEEFNGKLIHETAAELGVGLSLGEAKRLALQLAFAAQFLRQEHGIDDETLAQAGFISIVSDDRDEKKKSQSVYAAAPILLPQDIAARVHQVLENKNSAAAARARSNFEEGSGNRLSNFATGKSVQAAKDLAPVQQKFLDRRFRKAVSLHASGVTLTAGTLISPTGLSDALWQGAENQAGLLAKANALFEKERKNETGPVTLYDAQNADALNVKVPALHVIDLNSTDDIAKQATFLEQTLANIPTKPGEKSAIGVADPDQFNAAMASLPVGQAAAIQSKYTIVALSGDQLARYRNGELTPSERVNALIQTAGSHIQKVSYYTDPTHKVSFGDMLLPIDVFYVIPVEVIGVNGLTETYLLAAKQA
jgi:hypothetical protein